MPHSNNATTVNTSYHDDTEMLSQRGYGHIAWCCPLWQQNALPYAFWLPCTCMKCCLSASVGLQHAYLREALCADGWPREKHMRTPIEGSALLNLRELKVLKANWWNIYFKPAAASSSKSRPIELVLPELSTTARSELLHADHQSLLHAALRGGA